MPQFAPATVWAQQFGVKSVCYGPPGSGKTPLVNTAPRPVLLAVEPGLLSMRGSNVMTCYAPTVELIDDFFKWLFESAEARQNVETVCVDSISQIAEIYLEKELPKHKDPRKAYGEMSQKVMKHLNGLYYTRERNTYLIAKQGFEEIDGIRTRRPYFPGQDLGVKVPHLFDLVMYLDEVSMPSVGKVKALRTKSALGIFARDRGGKLAELEQPDLTMLFNKCTKE
jgi:hypothetical protein